MPRAWCISPYVTTRPEGMPPVRAPFREVALSGPLGPEQDGKPPPFDSVETLGNMAVCLVDIPDLTVLDSVPGVFTFPEEMLRTSKLSDHWNEARRRGVTDVLDAMGYTDEDRRRQLRVRGTRDLGDATLDEVLRFAITRRRKPRWDKENDTYVLDGDVRRASRGLPADAQAFGGTPQRDDFNRANEDPMNTNWAPMYQTTGHDEMRVVSNEAASETDASTYKFNASVYTGADTLARDQELGATMGTVLTTYHAHYLFTRLDPVAENGYFAYFSGTNEVQIYEMTGGSNTKLGADLASYDFVTGDKIGFESIDDTHSVYKDTGGGWGQHSTSRTDTTHMQAGKPGLAAEGDASTFCTMDDFFAGSVGSTRDVIQSGIIPFVR